MIWNNYPFFRQNNLQDCGVACLRMIAAHYGKQYTAQELRQFSGIDKLGTSLMGLKKTAEHIGFKAEGVQLTTPADFAAIDKELPCILFWENNHFVVLFQVTDNKFVIGDPARGIRRVSESQLTKSAFITTAGSQLPPQAYALLLQPTENSELVAPKANKVAEVEKKQWHFLIDKIKELRVFFLVTFLGIVASSVLQYLLPFITKSVVDLGIEAGDLAFVKFLLIGQLVIILSKTFFNIMRSWVVLHLSIRINYSLISNFLQKLFRLPLPFFETRKIGDVLQRINDHNRIESFITKNSLSLLIAVLSIGVYSLVLYHFHAFFFWLFAFTSGIYLLWITFFLKARKSIDVERFKLASENQSILIQTINGMHDLKINNSEAYSISKWKKNQLSYFNNTFRYLRVNQIQSTGTMLIIELAQLSILFLSASLIVKNEITLGTLLSIQFIIGQLIAPMEQIVQGVIQGQEAKISFDRIYEFWNEKDESTYAGNHTIQLPLQRQQQISLQNLTFRHPGQQKNPALQEVDLTIPFGKTTAIVGVSGSGKTTLLKLLLGFYYNYEGEIKVGDSSFRELDVEAWRAQCGVIMQESFIFDDTIRNNIILSDNSNEQQLERAAQTANIHQFVADLPQGYDTMIGRDGKGLSMGQKQRILMARAIYKKPSFIFMDEATNSLDADNEQTIMDNLKSFFKGRTVIIVAHRLSTIQFADNIVVMQEGRVAEQGTHHGLLQKQGKYYDLVKKQI